MASGSRCCNLDYFTLMMKIVSTKPVPTIKCKRVKNATSLVLTQASEELAETPAGSLNRSCCSER